MTDPIGATIAHPAHYVTQQAIAFGAVGDPPTSVEPARPLPVADRAYQGVAPFTIGADQPAGRGLLITCTAAGQTALRFADGSTATLPIATGLTILPFAVRAILIAGTTATASFASLI